MNTRTLPPTDECPKHHDSDLAEARYMLAIETLRGILEECKNTASQLIDDTMKYDAVCKYIERPNRTARLCLYDTVSDAWQGDPPTEDDFVTDYDPKNLKQRYRVYLDNPTTSEDYVIHSYREFVAVLGLTDTWKLTDKEDPKAVMVVEVHVKIEEVE